jgi:hypothetical protein
MNAMTRKERKVVAVFLRSLRCSFTFLVDRYCLFTFFINSTSSFLYGIPSLKKIS